ncbi:hypothetical protein O1M63_04235 [Streptomyces mirabilis]|nr:hypothetical protein [Streptomyces mirabilis]
MDVRPRPDFRPSRQRFLGMGAGVVPAAGNAKPASEASAASDRADTTVTVLC